MGEQMKKKKPIFHQLTFNYLWEIFNFLVNDTQTVRRKYVHKQPT